MRRLSSLGQAELGSGAASTPFGAGYGGRQSQSMPFAARVGRADKLFPPMLVDFQIISDLLAVRTTTKNCLIQWVVKAKVFHAILSYAL